MNTAELLDLPPEYKWSFASDDMTLVIRAKGVIGDKGIVAAYVPTSGTLILFLDDTNDGQTQSVSSIEEAVPLMAQACWLGLLVEGS